MFLKKRFRRIIAAYRFFSSRQQDIHGIRYPVLGSGLLILVLSAILLSEFIVCFSHRSFFLRLVVWSFAQTPYYRSRWNVGSPPLAIRTGFSALGLFPFILWAAFFASASTLPKRLTSSKCIWLQAQYHSFYCRCLPWKVTSISSMALPTF